MWTIISERTPKTESQSNLYLRPFHTKETHKAQFSAYASEGDSLIVTRISFKVHHSKNKIKIYYDEVFIVSDIFDSIIILDQMREESIISETIHMLTKCVVSIFSISDLYLYIFVYIALLILLNTGTLLALS